MTECQECTIQYPKEIPASGIVTNQAPVSPSGRAPLLARSQASKGARSKVHLVAVKKPATSAPLKAKTAKKATAKFSISSVATSHSWLAKRNLIQ